MADTDATNDPIEHLRGWLTEARATIPEADAMALATSDSEGRPSARIVLLRGLDERGVTFFTSRTSRKADELAANPYAAAVLHWWKLGRQVRVEGSVERTSDVESDAYWSTRPRGSQLAAWASQQSRLLRDRDELDQRVREAETRFTGANVARPDFWGGYRIVPECIEFWTHRDDRLHDRVRYVREPESWRRELLAP